MPREKGRTMVAQNRKARHDYHLHDTFEAGLVPVSYTHLTLPTILRV